MKKIIIRTDASLQIGSGHVIRCRTLARELHRRGASVTFICRDQPGSLIGTLQKEFEVRVLQRQSTQTKESQNRKSLNGNEIYKEWLGCNQSQDATESLNEISHMKLRKSDWIIVDHYGLDAIWEKQILKSFNKVETPKMMSIDDLANRPHCCDLLLDQNLFKNVDRCRYSNLVSNKCVKFLGPKYALLGPEYKSIRNSTPARKTIKRILVYYGSGDKNNLTGTALRILSAKNYLHLEVDVINSRSSPHFKEVESLILNRPLTNSYQEIPSLAGLIAKADLSFGAGGTTTWERACLGLPTIITPTADNQYESSEVLCDYVSLPLAKDNHVPKQLEHQLEYFLKTPGRLNDVSISLLKICDGTGTETLGKHLIEYKAL